MSDFKFTKRVKNVLYALVAAFFAALITMAIFPEVEGYVIVRIIVASIAAVIIFGIIFLMLDNYNKTHFVLIPLTFVSSNVFSQISNGLPATEPSTPLWLGLIIVLLGLCTNFLIKWIDVSVDGKEKFDFLYYWHTSKKQIFLSVIVIVSLLVLLPEIPTYIEIRGADVLGERVTYWLIGYAPITILKTVLKKTSIDKELFNLKK